MAIYIQALQLEININAMDAIIGALTGNSSTSNSSSRRNSSASSSSRSSWGQHWESSAWIDEKGWVEKIDAQVKEIRDQIIKEEEEKEKKVAKYKAIVDKPSTTRSGSQYQKK